MTDHYALTHLLLTTRDEDRYNYALVFHKEKASQGGRSWVWLGPCEELLVELERDAEQRGGEDKGHVDKWRKEGGREGASGRKTFLREVALLK